MEIIMLGTSSMVPTKDRNHSAIFIKYRDDGILVDCGEGTQRQLKIAKIKPTAVKKILISHWDGDHVLGLPGLIQTLAISEEDKHLAIYGPPGTKKRFEHLFKAFEFYNKITLDIHEITKKKFYDGEYYSMFAYALEHKVPSLGFEFIEKDRLRIDMNKAGKLGMKQGPLMGKLQQGQDVNFKGKKIRAKDVTYNVAGKKIGFISDTRPCTNCSLIAKDKNLLICDSTFHSRQEEKAHEYFHTTAKQAAELAARGNSKKLVLTHFSQRYKDVDELEEEAKMIFPNTVAAYDFMKIKV